MRRRSEDLEFLRAEAEVDKWIIDWKRAVPTTQKVTRKQLMDLLETLVAYREEFLSDVARRD